MSVVTVVATADPDSMPPRVRLDVTDTASPELFEVTVVRRDPDGRTRKVRTIDGGPLVLSTSGSDRVGIIFDYEAPYGAAVTYSTVESPATVSSTVTVPEGRIWLVHPGIPSLSMPVDLRAESFAEEVLPVRQGVFWPMGREFPVVQTDGVRRAPAGSITVRTRSLDELQALEDLLADGSTLLLNVPPSTGIGVGTRYISVADVVNRRFSDIGRNPRRNVVLPYQVVDRPAGGTTAARTYQDLLVSFATYEDLAAAHPTYYDVLVGQ